MSELRRNLELVRQRIAEAALRAGRTPTEVTLVAIAKAFAAELVAVRGPQPTWHMVGHVQSRKAEPVAELFDYVHSVDRLKIARRLDRFAVGMGRTLPVLLECNLSGEEAKYGFDVARWEKDAGQRDAFHAAVGEILELPGLSVRGLMTMAPITPDPERVRPVFARLRALLGYLREQYPAGDWRHLSMGMTDDFEVAVEEGATLVRIGRAIFGHRVT
jgi:pyridoxal phosphate enzyme (YggS family)